MITSNITFTSCWYNFKAKFPSTVYQSWIENMLSNVNNYYLVIYTDVDGYELLKKYDNVNIKIVVKPYTEFYTYKHKTLWEANHDGNLLLKDKVDWRVNMLWSEKIHFVKCAADENYFKTDYFGWCDIGYFRNRNNDTSTERLTHWPDHKKFNGLDKSKIHYALINNNQQYIHQLYSIITNKNSSGLPAYPIPPNQVSIAGGFFFTHIDNISWWHKTYYTQLQNYLDNKYLVKYDQMVIADCVFSNLDKFQLYRENEQHFDNWFMFQRILI
jgi:hypothetical protein